MENETVHCSFLIDSPLRRLRMFPTNVAVLVLNCVFCLTATVQNLPVIAAIVKTPSLHTPSNVLLCSLALTDLTVGCVVHPVFVAFKARLLQGEFLCLLLLVKEGLLIFTGILSMLILLAVSLERLLALRLHLRYGVHITIPRVLAVVIVTCLLWSLVVGTWPLGLSIKVVSSISLIVIVVVAVALVAVCAEIFRILRRHQMVIWNQNKLQAEVYRTASRRRKSAATILYVVVLFFVFYFLSVFATIRFIFTQDFNIAQNILWDIAETFALMNASVNPLLYYWKMGNIRRAVRRLFYASNQIHMPANKRTDYSTTFKL